MTHKELPPLIQPSLHLLALPLTAATANPLGKRLTATGPCPQETEVTFPPKLKTGFYFLLLPSYLVSLWPLTTEPPTCS